MLYEYNPNINLYYKTVCLQNITLSFVPFMRHLNTKLEPKHDYAGFVFRFKFTEENAYSLHVQPNIL